MKTIRVLFVALSLLAALVAVVPVQAASSVEDCQAHIANLRTATLSATFTGQNAAKDQANLVAKLDSASTKRTEGKEQDALTALTQFRDKVIILDAQGKIAPADAQTLIAGANAAILCTQNVIAGV